MTRTAPRPGRAEPPIIRSNVVLPQPDCPMMPTTLPRGISRLTSLRTGRDGSYPYQRFSMLMMGDSDTGKWANRQAGDCTRADSRRVKRTRPAAAFRL